MSMEVTPKAARQLLVEQEYSAALIMTLKLNEVNLIQEIIEQIPHTQIELVLESLPEAFVKRIAEFIAKMLNTPHIEFYLKWNNALLRKFGSKSELIDGQVLINLHQNLIRKYESLNQM